MDINENQDNNKQNYTQPNASTSDPTDGKIQYEWESKYPKAARKQIIIEQVFIFFIFFSSLFLLFATWKGWLGLLFADSASEALTIKKYGFYAFSGMLGGITFGMKYFYRVIARGYWHMDRRTWRIMSPFIAMTISVIVGTLIDGSILITNKPTSWAALVSTGFLAGYFADEAVGKMYEIASVIFGKSAAVKSGDENLKNGKNNNL